jgi:hypothetical protein
MTHTASYFVIATQMASCLRLPPPVVDPTAKDFDSSDFVTAFKSSDPQLDFKPELRYTDNAPAPGEFRINWSGSSVPAGQATSFNISASQNDFGSSIIYAWFQAFDARGEPAVFFAAPALPPSDGGDFVRIVQFKIMDPGEYEVHLMLHRGENNGHAHGNGQSNRPLPGTPFRFIVADDTLEEHRAQAVAIKMPSSTCAGINGNGEGRWVRCDLAGENCLRDGWRYVNHNCQFSIFTPGQILAASAAIGNRSPWIVVMGSSIIRGTLHTMLDYIGDGRLSAHQSINIPDVIFGEVGVDRPGEGSTTKCWGWSDFQLDALRLSYQDSRFIYAKAEDYAAGMFNRLEKLFIEGPTIIHMEIGGDEHLIIPKLFTLMDRTGYIGKILLSETKPRFLGPFERMLSPPVYVDRIALLISDGEEQFPRLRNRVFHQDESYMGYAALFDMEYPLDNSENTAQHFHRYRLGGPPGRRLYGIAAEMSAMMIFNALMIEPQGVSSMNNYSSTLSAKMCVSCPERACCGQSSVDWLPPENPSYTLSDPVFTMSDALHGCTWLR